VVWWCWEKKGSVEVGGEVRAVKRDRRERRGEKRREEKREETCELELAC
tara:strand:+ start:388 stop:534 length:147 start_codon:yes stop_codon:yes gene_type:complete